MLVRLQPGLRQVWRGPQTVQIGLTAQRGAVLDGLTDDDAALLVRLRHGLDLGELDAGRIPPGATRGRELLRLLDQTGLLLTAGSGRAVLTRLGNARHRLVPDATAWALSSRSAGDGWGLVEARAAAVVEVRGGGRTACSLVATLTAAGVGVRVVDDALVGSDDVCPAGPRPHEVGRPRGEVLARRTGAMWVRGTQPSDGAPPDVVVLIARGAADAESAQALHERQVPHLSVVVREADVVVGPLVRPGHGPCLHCLDLHRSDRDPRWAHVLAQLLSTGPNGGCDGPWPEEVATSTVAGALAALQVVAQLDGRPDAAALGATLEVELPDGLVCRRPWPAHPACGCWWLPGQLPTNGFGQTGPGSGARPGPATVTMVL